MSESEPDQSDALTEEQDHLERSRATLNRMHVHAGGLKAVGAAAVSEGPNVSTEYLKQVLYRRTKSLIDDPTVPLFFGRIDYSRPDLPGTIHIGRRHVTGEAGGEPMVIDWRAPVALPFYRATKDDPMGVRLRRRFGYAHGELTAYEDEDLVAGDELEHSEILEAEIARPRTGPMRDIVATIQPEQDVLVRSGLEGSVCIQGAPGTGKTAVGLHRAAYLLYTHRDQLDRSGLMVIGPNDSFLSYIGDVLPALGEIAATQETVGSVLTKATGLRPSAEDPAAVAMIKGDGRMADVIRKAIWNHLRPATETMVVQRGSRQFRVAPYLADEIVASIRERGVRYAAGRDMVPQRLAHQVLLRLEAAGDSPDDRVQNAVARSRPVKTHAESLWPAIDPAKLILRLLTDAEFLAEHADGILTETEQATLRPAKLPRSVKSARWTTADLALIDEAADVLTRTPSLGHLIIDEAQDLSAMQLRAVGRRASTGSVTVLGDLAQATTPWATTSWAETLAHLGKPDAAVEELIAGFRVPAAVIEYAGRLLPTIAPTLAPPYSIRQSRGDLRVSASDALSDDLVAAVGAALAREGSVGLIIPDAMISTVEQVLDDHDLGHGVLGRERPPSTDEADGADAADGADGADQADESDPEEVFRHRLDIVAASLAKGLEFDHVVLLEPAAVVAAEPDRPTGLRRLYVCLTRAVTSLQVLHTEPLPAELTG